MSQEVTVSTEVPLLESQSSQVGQVISTETINNTPLNGSNWVYIAQLTSGVAPPFGTCVEVEQAILWQMVNVPNRTISS